MPSSPLTLRRILRSIPFRLACVGLILFALLAWLFFHLSAPKITWTRTSASSPVMVTDLWFDDGAWSGVGGLVYADPSALPGGGGGATISASLPTKAEARWYDPLRQCYYEAVLIDPKINRKARKLLEAQPLREYSLTLVAFLRGADLELWLRGIEEPVGRDSHVFSERLSVAQGHVAPGDAAKYAPAVRLLIREKKIPADTPIPGSKE